MKDVWPRFDEEVRRMFEYTRDHVAPAADAAVKAGACYLIADSFATAVPDLLLAGRRDAALESAQQGEKYSLISIGRKRGHAELGRGVTPEMAKGRMWFNVYTCRWFLTGAEDFEALRSAMESLEAAVKADVSARRAPWRQDNAAFLGGLAGRLGLFDTANEYAVQSKGLVTYERGTESREPYPTLFLDICAYLCGKDASDSKRREIVSTFRAVFDQARSGAVYIAPGAHGTYASLRNLAYFGLKYFEELREGKEFTYENVVRSLRYE